MLKSLLIKNFILIDELKLDFKFGFNVLCGETGAGKSIIIKALDCALGAKTPPSFALDNQKSSIIEAAFELDNEEIVISREITSTSKYRLNGVLVSSDEIKTLKEKLLDIHSQHQTYSYMQTKNHIILLDNYIFKKTNEYNDLLKNYKNSFTEYEEYKKKLENLKKNFEENEREIEFLRFQLKELDDAAIKENEEDEIKQELDILSNVQELKENTQNAYWALGGDNSSIIEALSKIKYLISNSAELDKSLNEPMEWIYDAYENLKESANYLRDYSSNLEFNPQRLDELNERISLIQKLKRKYGSDLDIEREKIAKKLDELTNGDNDIETVEKNYQIAFEAMSFLAEKIEQYRQKEAVELSKLIEEKLKNLELKEAKFEISIEKTDFNSNGRNKVEFLISTNKNQSLNPLSRVASGGEISRVMLALKTIFCEVDKVQTVIFDEIDTGISGITSNACANVILELSQHTQILCITHQPIICAKANNFVWVSKNQNETSKVSAKILSEEEKIQALAQLASGEITEKTVEFAKTLIK